MDIQSTNSTKSFTNDLFIDTRGNYENLTISLQDQLIRVPRRPDCVHTVPRMAYKMIKHIVFYIFRYADDGVCRGQIQTRKDGVHGWERVINQQRATATIRLPIAHVSQEVTHRFTLPIYQSPKA